MSGLPQSPPAQDKRSFKQKFEELKRTVRERRLAAGAIVAGIVLLFLPYLLEPEHPLPGVEWLYHLIRDLGIAAIVSAVVAILLEKQSKRAIESHFNDQLQEFQDKIKPGLVKAMYPSLPPELFALVEESLLKARFVRNIYRTEVELHDFTDDYIKVQPALIRNALTKCKESLVAIRPRDLVVLEMISSYEVENISGGEAQWVVPFQVAAVIEEGCPGQCAITLFKINSEAPVIGGGKPKIYGERPEDDPNALVHTERVQIKPGDKGFVKIHAYTLRHATDSEAWLVLMPSEGMTVSVTDRNENKAITLTRLAPNPKNDIATVTNGQGADATLEIKQFLLPYQGIEIKWRPRAVNNPQKISAAAS